MFEVCLLDCHLLVKYSVAIIGKVVGLLLGSGTGFSASLSSWLATSKHFLATSSKNILLDVGDVEVNLAASVTDVGATDVWAGLGI